MAEVKIQIKAGSFEINYEGEGDFLKDEVFPIIAELQKIEPISAPPHAKPLHQEGHAGTHSSQHSLTTKSIATKLNAKSGSEVAEAAVAHLAIIRGMATFKRSDINDAMKSAAGIYKSNMSSNLSKIVQTLLNQEVLVETGTDIYALTPKAEAGLKGRLEIG